MGSVRNQLSSLTVGQLEGGQISSAGGKVFVSSNALTAQAETEAITKTWRAVHAPSYGVPIPNSAQVANVAGDADVVTTSANETVFIHALSCTNADLVNPAAVNLFINAVMVASLEVPPANNASIVGLGALPSLTLTHPQTLTVSVSGVTGTDLTTDCAYSLLIQG